MESASTNMADVLREYSNCTHTLSNLLKDSFGPDGRDVALKSCTGNILITKSGIPILKSLTSRKVFYKLVIEHSCKLNARIGDGSKAFIIVLNRVSQGLSRYLNETRNYQNFSAVQFQIYVNIFKLLKEVDKVVSRVEKHAQYFDLTSAPTEEIARVLRKVITSALKGSFTEETSELLVDLVISFLESLFQNSMPYLRQHIHEVDKIFNQCIIEITGPSIFCSKILKGIVIPRDILSFDKAISVVNRCRFVLLKVSHDLLPTTPSAIALQDKHQYNGLNLCFGEELKNFISVLKQSEVQLVISEDRLLPQVKLVLMKNFLVIEAVQETMSLRISKCFNILPIESFRDTFNAFEIASFIGNATFLKELLLGNRRFVQVGTPYHEYGYPTCSFILCSPSQGIGSQYITALENVMSTVKMTFEWNPSNRFSVDCMKVLPGCGAVEYLLSCIFGRMQATASCEAHHALLKSLQEGFRDIPLILHSNSLANTTTKKRFCDFELAFQKNFDQNDGASPWIFGVDYLHGSLTCKSGNIVEPFYSKIAALEAILMLLGQVFRIERVIHVKMLSHEQVDVKEDDLSD